MGTEEPDMLQSMRSQRVRHNLVTQQQQQQQQQQCTELDFEAFTVMSDGNVCCIALTYKINGASLVVQLLKNLPAMQETLV